MGEKEERRVILSGSDGNPAEIKVGPSHFRSAANRVCRVPARGVVGRLKSKKEYNKMNLLNSK